jgi:hypothetical protein
MKECPRSPLSLDETRLSDLLRRGCIAKATCAMNMLWSDNRLSLLTLRRPVLAWMRLVAATSAYRLV